MSHFSKHDLGQVLGQQKYRLNCTPELSVEVRLQDEEPGVDGERVHDSHGGEHREEVSNE